MTKTNNALEEECEDAVFKLACTRERYSVRCAKQLEKYLKLYTDKQITEVQITRPPNFEKPVTTEEQTNLFNEYKVSCESEILKTYKNDVRHILKRLKELNSIVRKIEQSKNSEMHQLLK